MPQTHTPGRIDGTEDGGVGVNATLTALTDTSNRFLPKKQAVAHLLWIQNTDGSNSVVVTVPSATSPTPGEKAANVQFTVAAGEDQIIRIGEWARTTPNGYMRFTTDITANINAGVFWVR